MNAYGLPATSGLAGVLKHRHLFFLEHRPWFLVIGCVEQLVDWSFKKLTEQAPKM
jgi:hypothetical protein